MALKVVYPSFTTTPTTASPSQARTCATALPSPVTSVMGTPKWPAIAALMPSSPVDRPSRRTSWT